MGTIKNNSHKPLYIGLDKNKLYILFSLCMGLPHIALFCLVENISGIQERATMQQFEI